MNPLKIELQNKVVELASEALESGTDPRFLCEGGFGCYPFTMGSKIHGRFVADGVEAVIPSAIVRALHPDQTVRPPAKGGQPA